jgi:ATP-dependent DNA helicase RecG
MSSKGPLELFDDRLEVSNPGAPSIDPERFIDEYQSRNEALADLMRRSGICEEKGSGIDKVVASAEVHQLPPPEFRADSIRTTAILFAYRDFKNMSKLERIRACYQHCALLYVSGQRMSNESLRRRLGLNDKQAGLASQIITATKEKGLIQLEPSDSISTRYARYLPFWA